ncbi:hypothetical protein C8F04DRAFT_1183736 [Mycena alexandri]|uniref:HAT C-terminal dimerisation domain-containing protein n=1 Tax=Mycena alexandri TaxID=1745969 RepID=A0AAD6SUC6_9AGAR|nr:hypothetical protein C8F04DRAFT_1183736 [Mycena alexandri]
MPSLKEGETFDPKKYPDLFKILRASARAILKGEQARTGKSSKADADRLTEQLIRWAVGLPPFHQRTYSTADENPLEYWKGLKRDSNADVLATVAIIIFSIMPSELCDERTASFLGWVNAARRSSITPEHLVGSAQLSQWYKFGLTEGNYTHKATANVKVSEVGSSSTILSAPSLLDLLNDENIAPQDVDREALEKALFDLPDPYDLDETLRVDRTISADLPQAAQSTPPMVYRSSVHWAVSDYVRLDSVALAELILPKNKESTAPEVVGTTEAATAAVQDEDWDVDDT